MKNSMRISISPRRSLAVGLKRRQEEYHVRVSKCAIEKANLGHTQVVRPKGNAMTQTFYTANILPNYIDAVQLLRAENLEKWESPGGQLQEDNDTSHGTRYDGIAMQLKLQN
ncbi:MAG: hypothetical protein L6R37_004849 [Teloschistes peruensis]|nr:MAG: hypothetical protein L6R37_004849 [Teloschistes peruensis]